MGDPSRGVIAERGERVKRFEAGKLTIELELDEAASAPCIRWIGESDALTPLEGLAPIFKEILGQISGGHVELRFDELRYMNSASVGPIMAFLRDLSAAADRVSVRYREDVPWQRTSFRAMRVVARKWANVEVLGTATRRPG